MKSLGFLTSIMVLGVPLLSAGGPDLEIPCNPSYEEICKDEVPIFWASELVNTDLATEMLDLFWAEEPDSFSNQPQPIKIAVVDSGFNEETSDRFDPIPLIKLGQYDIRGEFHEAIEEGKDSPERFVELMDAIILKRLWEDERDWDGNLAHSHRTDPSGHGTMVSGLIAAENGDGLGRGIHLTVYGVQDFAELGAFGAVRKQILGREGGWLSAVYEACRDGAQIINLSMGLDDPEKELRFAELYSPLLDYLHNNGCLLVKAAGNDSAQGESALQRRARHPALITVAGIQLNGNTSGFSNAGILTGPATGVGVLRPANLKTGNIRPELLCQNDDYLQIGGTSFAAPITSRVASLVIEVLQRSDRYADLSPQERVDVLVAILSSTNQNQASEIDAARAVRVAIHWGRSGQMTEEFPEIREFCRTTFHFMPQMSCPRFRDRVRDLRFQVSLCSEDRAKRLEFLGDVYRAANRHQEAARWYNQAVNIEGDRSEVSVIEAAWQLEEALWNDWIDEDESSLNPDLGRTVNQLTLLWGKTEDSDQAITQFETVFWSPYFRHMATDSETTGADDAKRLISELFQELEGKVGFNRVFRIITSKIERTATEEDRSNLFWRKSVAIFLLLSRLERDDRENQLEEEEREQLVDSIGELETFFFNSDEARVYAKAVDESRRPWNALLRSPLSRSIEMVDSAIERGDASDVPTVLLSFAFREGRSHFGEERIRQLEILSIAEFARNSDAFNGYSRLVQEMIEASREAPSRLSAIADAYLDGLDETYSSERVTMLSFFIKSYVEFGVDSDTIGPLKVALASQVIAGGPVELSSSAAVAPSLFGGSGFDSIVEGLIHSRAGDEYEAQIDYLALSDLVFETLRLVPTLLIRGHSEYIEDGEWRERRKKRREFMLVKLLHGCLFYNPSTIDFSRVERRPSITEEDLERIRQAARNVLSFDQSRSRRARNYRFDRVTRQGLEAILEDTVSGSDLYLNSSLLR